MELPRKGDDHIQSLHCRLHEAWIAANAFFGSIWNSLDEDQEVVYDASAQTEPPKDLWKMLSLEITAGGFPEDQIYNAKDSAHNMCALCERERFKGETSTIQDWKNLFTKISIKNSKNLFEPERIMKTLLVRMARTDPSRLPG